MADPKPRSPADQTPGIEINALWTIRIQTDAIIPQIERRAYTLLPDRALCSALVFTLSR